MRVSPALSTTLACLVALHVPAQQPLSDEDKKRLFLKAREEMTTIPYTPPASTGSAQKPKPRPDGTPKPRATPGPAVKATPEPPPRATPAPTSAQPPATTQPPATGNPPPTRANIVVKKETVAQADEQPEPTPQPRSMWSRIFGRPEPGYRYLTGSVRRAIDGAPVSRGRWRYIVIHNSGTRQGGARAFEHYHRYVRRMPNGLAYHFVIGNGTTTRDGAIEIGNRWYGQIRGGHVHSDYLNNIAIGICLVGDFNQETPTKAQRDALGELTDYLRGRVGRIQGQAALVRPHKNINPVQWPTDCPGGKFPYGWLETRF